MIRPESVSTFLLHQLWRCLPAEVREEVVPERMRDEIEAALQREGVAQ